MAKTRIEWADMTWNFLFGCRKVSAGCLHCYAEGFSRRLAGKGIKGYEGVVDEGGWTGRVNFVPERLQEPFGWRSPRRVFVCSMSDLFGPGVEFEWVDAAFEVMSACPQHQFMLLTKRAERMYEYFWGKNRWPNIWGGVTVEIEGMMAYKRLSYLIDAKVAHRFVSMEPLLGAVEISEYMRPKYGCNYIDPEDGSCTHPDMPTPECHLGADCPYPYMGLELVIAGGESGIGARPMHPNWVRGVRDQCERMGVPFFFKSWGAWAPYEEWMGQDYPVEGVDDGQGDVVLMARVGKRLSGRVLDGRVWDGE